MEKMNFNMKEDNKYVICFMNHILISLLSRELRKLYIYIFTVKTQYLKS